MKGMQSEPGYKSYILRVWHVMHDDQPATVAALEDCQTSQRLMFPNLDGIDGF